MRQDVLCELDHEILRILSRHRKWPDHHLLNASAHQRAATRHHLRGGADGRSRVVLDTGKLLGLKQGEADIARIEQQVYERMEKVRRYQLTHP